VAIRGDLRGFCGFDASRKKAKRRLAPRLRSGQDFELGEGFGCLREAIWGIWVREKWSKAQVFTQMRKVFQSKTQVFAPKTQALRQNVRKRSKIFKKLCKTFENIRKVV